MPSKDRTGTLPFGPGGALGGVLVVVLVVGGLFWSAASGRPASAQRPQLFGGSLVLGDTRPLTVINVATAQVTVRLEGVNAQVGATTDGDVQPVPVDGGTMLVNRVTGTFNFLAADNFVTDPDGAGVGLGRLDGSTGAMGYGSGADAYIVRSAPESTVSLVGEQTVAQASKLQSGSSGGSKPAAAAAVPPLGFSAVGGQVSLQPGEATVSGSDLWVLVAGTRGCRVVQLQPAPTSRQGLASVDHGSVPACGQAALETGAGVVGVATPGHVLLYPATGRPAVVSVAATAQASQIRAVTGAGGRLWYLAEDAKGWELFGVGLGARTEGPYALNRFGAGSNPVVPVLSGGFLYTLDQAQTGQPTLWTIDTANGRMAPLSGTPRYPAVSPSERPGFSGAQVILDGPRVVFNNPQSLEAVVVFTDERRLPQVVNKSQAISVSATGPADLGATPATSQSNGGPSGSSGSSRIPVPVIQPVSKAVTCAQTTQKPYAPQVTGITASSGTALIQWSYELLDQTDCEPDTWTVDVTALTGSHQPAAPLQVVSGQDQYLFRGLRPSTTYQAVVTAFINRQSTPSSPATFTTAARGPDAPLQVHTHADGQGNWVVSWVPCTETANPNCVVPADEWTVTGAACNGTFVGSPPSVQVPGGQDSVTVSATDLKLLGDNLSFTVQGSLSSGLAGNPTADGACTEAYQKPDAAAIAISGQGVEDSSGHTITATVTVATTGDPDTVFGVPPRAAQFVYTLTSPAGTRTVGPTDQTDVVVPGLPAGVSLVPSVLIYPNGHPDDSVTVTGPAFQQTLAWPDLSAAGATGVLSKSDPDQGTVTVNLPPDTPTGPLSAVAPPSANSPGAGPQVQCGGAGGAVQSYPVQAVGLDRQFTLPMSDLVDEGGDCSVSFSLVDGANPDPYGGPSPAVALPFTIGTPPPTYDFTYKYVGCDHYECGPLGNQYTIEVDTNDQFQGGGDWAVTTKDGDLPQQADPCYASVGAPNLPDGFSIQLPQDCVPTGSLGVTVTWRYIGQEQSSAASAANSPGPPATPVPTTTTTTRPPCSTTTSSSSSTSSSTTTTTSAASHLRSSASTGCTTSSSSAGTPTGASAGAAGANATTAVEAAAGTGLPAVALAAAWGVGAGRRKLSRCRTRRAGKPEKESR